MNEIKALSFDMYRTLLDTRDFHEQAVREILALWAGDSVNSDIFHTRWDEHYDHVHLEMPKGEFMTEREVATESLRRTLDEFGIDGDAAAGVEIWMGKYGDADLYPEVEEVLNTLSARYPMVVVSNVDDDDVGYGAFRGKNLPFRAIITSDSLKSYKPDGRIFREALSVLKCRPEEVLHTGDSQRADVLGAKKAGMRAAWLNRRSDRLKSGIPKPDYELADLRELLHFL